MWGIGIVGVKNRGFLYAFFNCFHASYLVTMNSVEIILQKAHVGMTLWQHAKMTTILKSPEGLKDSERKKGQLNSPPPIPDVPSTDLVVTKKSLINMNTMVIVSLNLTTSFCH
jgi:hypothetical protein